MIFLGIDYGKRKIGLSLGDDETKLSQPLKVLRVKTKNEAIKKIANEVRVNNVETIVLGVSEGNTKKETEEFGKELVKQVPITLLYQDETLTTHDAQTLSREAGIGQKKRREKEDAYAAALILQSYFDSV